MVHLVHGRHHGKFRTLCLQILRLILIIIITIQAGGIGCGIYTTNNPEACHYIADNCSANIIFAENKVQVAKILQVNVFFYHPAHTFN